MGPLIVTAIRLVIPLAIFKWALWGTIASALADTLDVILITILQSGDFSHYHNMDKILDTYFMTFTAITVFKWKNQVMKKICLSLFVWRMIGFFAFEYSNLRYLLVVFPNLFLTFFIYYLLYLKLFKKDIFTKPKPILLFLLFVILIKIPRELALHYLELQPWNWVKANIFPLLFY